MALSSTLSQRLDARMVSATLSRLVIDLNRPPDAPSAMPTRVEVIDIPGNRNLTDAERAARIREVYDPFHQTVADVLDNVSDPPVLVTIHSFTPIWNGVARPTEIGVLHDADPALAEAMMRASQGPYRIALNAPYSASDGVTHMLQRHGTARAIRNVMIEIRNDLLADETGVEAIANMLAPILTSAVHEVGRP